MPIHSTPIVPISWGELIDKISILEIKKINIKSEVSLINIEKELSQLKLIATQNTNLFYIIFDLYSELFNINSSLWKIEDCIREKESKLEFDDEFIDLARNVYKKNDQRALLKREINRILVSELIEEKSYKGFNG
jgi:hypothetical protein